VQPRQEWREIAILRRNRVPGENTHTRKSNVFGNRNMRSPIVAAVTVVGAVWIGSALVSDVAAAFAPRLPWTSLHHRPVIHLATSTTGTTPATPTSTEVENRLTDQEEEILFGDTINGQVPSHERHRDKFGNLLVDKTMPLNPLDHSPNDPVINKLRSMRDSLQSCPDVWRQLATICPNLRAVYDEHLSDTVIDETFAQFSVSVQKSAAVFAQQLGVQLNAKVAVFGENSAMWLMIDQGIQSAGGVTAVRGADAPVDELRYIYEHCDSAGIAVLQGPKLLQKLMAASNSSTGSQKNNRLGLSNAAHGPVRTIVLMHREKVADEQIQQWAAQLSVQIHVFADLLASVSTTALLSLQPRPTLTKASLATIVYTSGTTGNPKGVMLTQGNLLHQTGHRLAPSMPYEATEPLPGETMVSLLPGTNKDRYILTRILLAWVLLYCI
jgi:AMP-binding enzyme